jgi:hypothetical protein
MLFEWKRLFKAAIGEELPLHFKTEGFFLLDLFLCFSYI